MSRRADLATLVVAVVVHAAFAVAIARERVAKRPPTSTVELEFARQPPAVVRQSAAAPGPQHLTAAPKPRRQLALRAHAAPASHPAETAAPSPPSLSPSPSPSPSPPTRPIFAVSMASTSEVATGPSLPRGSPTGANSPRPGGAPTGNPGGPAAGNGEGAYQPVSESDVTTMPEIDTDACGKSIAYPDEAEAAGIEGDVRLRVSLTPEGHVYAVHVLSGLGHGLDRAATEALRHRCRFSPAIGKAGKPVAFVIQSYTFHFQLPR